MLEGTCAHCFLPFVALVCTSILCTCVPIKVLQMNTCRLMRQNDNKYLWVFPFSMNKLKNYLVIAIALSSSAAASLFLSYMEDELRHVRNSYQPVCTLQHIKHIRGKKWEEWEQGDVESRSENTDTFAAQRASCSYIHRFSSTLVSACISINVCAVKNLTDKAFSVHKPWAGKTRLLSDTHTTQHCPLLVIKRQTFGYITFDYTCSLKLIASVRTKISGLGVVRVNSVSSLCGKLWLCIMQCEQSPTSWISC